MKANAKKFDINEIQAMIDTIDIKIIQSNMELVIKNLVKSKKNYENAVKFGTIEEQDRCYIIMSNIYIKLLRLQQIIEEAVSYEIKDSIHFITEDSFLKLKTFIADSTSKPVDSIDIELTTGGIFTIYAHKNDDESYTYSIKRWYMNREIKKIEWVYTPNNEGKIPGKQITSCVKRIINVLQEYIIDQSR